MRRLLLLCLLSLVFSGLAQAQTVHEMPCAAVSLRAFLQRRAESLELAERIEATASVDELVALTAEYIDTVQVLPFSGSFCIEGYETVWRLDQLLNDVYAAQAMRLLGVADEDNTYLQALRRDHELVEEQALALEALLESGEREGLKSTISGTGGECFHENMIFPVERWHAHEALMKSVEAIETVADILEVGSAISAWRERTWTVIPACFEPFLHLMELGQLAQFVSMQRALEFGGESDEDDPFAETLDQMLHPRYGWFGGSFHDERLRVWKRPAPTVFGIAKCSSEDIESFAHIPAEYDELIADAQSEVDSEHRLAFMRRQAAWRHRLWLGLPMCQEVLELAWLMRQISSDYAVKFSLQMLADDDVIPALTTHTHADIRSQLRLTQLRKRFDLYRAGEGDLPETAAAASFTCGDQLTDEAFDGISADFRGLVGQAREITSVADAVRYFEKELQRRDKYFAGLPGCPEAIELGWWTSMRASTEALAKMLELAGVPEAENPYVIENEHTFRRWFKVSEDLRTGFPLPKERGAPGMGRLRSCSGADISSIANAAETYEDMLDYPRVFSIAEMVVYATTYLEWRDIGFRDFPVCAEAHGIRLDYTQIVGDVIARRMIDIDGRLYGVNPWRQLPDDFVRLDRLGEALFEARLPSGPPPDQRDVPVCSADEIETVSDLASGILAIAQSGESFEYQADLPAFHQKILNWRAELMARLPQCAGAVELGWLMNDIHIDLAVLGSLIYVGADVDALPQPKVIEENLESMSLLARELGIETEASPTR